MAIVAVNVTAMVEATIAPSIHYRQPVDTMIASWLLD